MQWGNSVDNNNFSTIAQWSTNPTETGNDIPDIINSVEETESTTEEVKASRSQGVAFYLKEEMLWQKLAKNFRQRKMKIRTPQNTQLKSGTLILRVWNWNRVILGQLVDVHEFCINSEDVY